MQPQTPMSPATPAQPTQAKPPRRKKSLADILIILMIATGVAMLVVAVAWLVIVLLGKTSSDTGKTQVGAAAILEPATASPKPVSVVSKLGITVPYNARELDGFGLAEDGITYSASDLEESRAYSVVRVRPVETSEATRNEITLTSPELRITATSDANYWKQFVAKKDYKDSSKVDILVKEAVLNKTKDKNVTASDAEVKTINGIDYREVKFTTKNSDYSITTVTLEQCYITVQNDRPFTACIHDIRDSNFGVVSQLENVLAGISYQKPDESMLTDTKDEKSLNKNLLDSKSDEKVTGASQSLTDAAAKDNKGTKTKLPTYLEDSKDFAVLAKSVPSVVRVGTIYCADISLTLSGQSTGPQLTGSCIDKAGTGFIASQDGTIATSASNIAVTPQEAIDAYITNAPDSNTMYDRLHRVLDYMVEARILMQTDADAIVAGVQQRDPEIVAKVNNLGSIIDPEDIGVAKETYKYAVQLSDKPMVVNAKGDGSLDFAYTDNILDAAVITQVFSTDKSPTEIMNGNIPASNAALLKVKKTMSYPSLALASGGVASGSLVDIAGMPMYAFGPLGSAQMRSMPMYRQGKADQVFSDAGSGRVTSITTSSHAGLDGAPALNDMGQVAGVATYGTLNCPAGKCFGQTVVRDISGVATLVKNKNISLKTSSVVNETWDKAVESLVQGNYSNARILFEKSAQLYPQNYLASQFAAYSKSQMGSVSDTSTANSIVTMLQGLLVMCIILLIVLVIGRLGLTVFSKPHLETQYGQMAGGTYIDPNQWQHQNISQPPTQVPQPQSWQSPNPDIQQAPVQPPAPAVQPIMQGYSPYPVPTSIEPAPQAVNPAPMLPPVETPLPVAQSPVNQQTPPPQQ